MLSSSVPSRAPGRGWLTSLLLRLHFYAGILVGPFVLVAAVSGALYALSAPVERVVYAHELRVAPAAQDLSLAEQVAIADSHVGDGSALTAVRPAPEPGATTRVMYAADGLGESESRAVFIDPGTGEIRGDLTVYGTSGSLPLRAWIDQLHRSLHLGDVGRLYSELAASWLWIVAGAGLVLWLRRGLGARGTRRTGRSRPRPTGYRRLLRTHTVLGACVLLGAFFLSATGITWSQHAGSTVTELREELGWATPTVATGPDPAAAPAHAHHAGMMDMPGDRVSPEAVEQVLLAARDAGVDAGAVEILPPAQPGSAWVVQEIQRSYPTQVDAVAIDGATGHVLDRADFADYPLMAKLARWGVDIHMGTMFGLVNQLAVAAVALGIATMVVLGYVLWWSRRPRGAPRPVPGRPPRRGALRGAPWWALPAAGAVAIAVGLLLPLVGWTLMAFLAVDAAIGLLTVRRETSARPTSPPPLPARRAPRPDEGEPPSHGPRRR
ncbi:PepSY-associated TM helix domain-containing protein [Brachybacterium hainanense]|uniref:PepSY-associated TM helix domain-containing protein n=1 Tax=Brachybacterium hainanense TaxID=1541174 RepID=A0ABV6RCN0_9MICO